MTTPLTDKQSQALTWSMGLTPVLVGTMTLALVWILNYLN